jgi:hypothetical protein
MRWLGDVKGKSVERGERQQGERLPITRFEITVFEGGEDG